jgi:hypothetical protein
MVGARTAGCDSDTAAEHQLGSAGRGQTGEAPPLGRDWLRGGPAEPRGPMGRPYAARMLDADRAGPGARPPCAPRTTGSAGLRGGPASEARAGGGRGLELPVS